LKRDLDVPYVPTSYFVVNRMLTIAGFKSTDLVYDLGAGDRIILLATTRFGARTVGVELHTLKGLT
jgi:phospholipid N-methyltransferase